MKGVKLQLCRVDINGNQIGNSIADAITGESGEYLFNNLESGRYVVKIVASSLSIDTTVSDKVDAGSDANDSDFDPQTLTSQIITVSSNSPTHLDIDAALIGACMPGICLPVTFKVNKIVD